MRLSTRLASSLCLFSLCWALAGTAAATEVYRWKDANGITQYGERPPEGVSAQRVALRAEPSVAPAPPAAGDAATAAPIDDPNLSADERAERARQRALEAAAEARRQTRAAACARAQQNLQVLRANDYVSLREGEGTRTLTANERQEQIAENERAEAEHCSPEADIGS